MTAETSNARGEVVAREARDPDDGTRWVTRHARERDGWAGLGRTIRPLTYADATPPPPAAARGDVRARQRSAAELQKFIDLAADYDLDEQAIAALEAGIAALAAEGVQAGEVETRARDALKREPGQQEGESASGYALRIATAALSQQPEARGVVDEAMVERAYRAWRKAAVAREGNRPAIRAALTAALTEARNVR